VTSGTDIDHRRADAAQVVPADVNASGAKRSAASRQRSNKRGLVGTLAALGVVALGVAAVAPTGMALAGQPDVDVHTPFSLALQDTQNLTVSVEGATTEPVARGVFEVYVTPTPTPEPEPEVASAEGGGGGGRAPLYYTGGGAPAEWMAAAGIASSDWGYVNAIVSRESGWNPNATNRSSGACGLVQVYPCSKLENAYDPVVNLRWANGYATGRYGSWPDAVAFWQNNHWW
jgi:hypothetical protein